ncbi:lipoyl synthase [Chloroflexota bacterium]
MESTKPHWLTKPLPYGEHLIEVGRVLSRLKLHTVCQSALCPNMGECFSRKTATFMIMGNICTRNCYFCAVDKGTPKPLETDEPARIARAAEDLKLLHIVVTSVTRDDLSDGGANHFAQTIAAVREINQNATVEVLIPDFCGSREAIEVVVDAEPDIINHNLETIPRLYSKVRPKADYLRSLDILKQVKELDGGIFTKSGIMLGLGEEEEEILTVMKDLCQIDCDFFTLGQYLSPSQDHLPVARYIPPEEFEYLASKGKEMGFHGIASGPFVRSSYRADELLREGKEI